MAEGSLPQKAAEFAAEVQALLDAVLPGERAVRAVQLADRYVVRPEGNGVEPEFNVRDPDDGPRPGNPDNLKRW